MQIKKVVIYGYGKLENITIPIDSSIHVFFGENEAGKSTIMSFIHSILFGFPTKQHTELRYEPKQQAKYGGKLEIVFPDTGLAIIERVKGKASGDVTVLLEDGTRGQEDLLEKLLLEIDKGTFQSIFSFSLQGLQNVQQLKGEELGRYLFSTGAVGSDVLLKVENDLQKELDIRFKPSGKKPLLNEKLAILRDKYSELKKAEKESSQYEELLTLKAKLEKEIEDAEQELEQEEYEKRQLEDWMKIRPIVLEKNEIEKKLEEVEKVTFPQDGVHRWESIKEQLITIEAKIKHHDHKWTEIEKELSGITCNEELVKHENTILLAIEKLPVYEQFQQRKLKLQNQLEIVEGEIANLKDQLHLSIEEEFIIENSNTSIFMKEQCANAASKQRHLKEQKVELDNRLREEQTTLESMEETIKELKTRLLSNEERKKLEDLVSNENQAKWYKEKANLLEREMNQVTELLGKEKERAKHNTILLSTFSFICLLLAVISFFFHQWLVLFLGLSFCIVSTFLFVGGRNRANKEMKKQQKKMNLLHEERKSLLTSVERGNDLSLIEERKLKEDTLLREQYMQLQFKLEQQNNNYERVLQGFEKWEADYLAHQQLLRNLAKELQIPYELAIQQIFNAFMLIDDWKGKEKERKSISNEINTIWRESEHISHTITKLFHQFISQDEDTIPNMCYRLKQNLAEEKKKEKVRSDLKRKQGEIKEKIESYQTELNHYLHEKKKLFSIAAVEEEEGFHKIASIDKERRNYMERLSTIQLQLKMSNIPKEKYQEYELILEPEEQLLKKQDKLKTLSTSIKSLMEQLASNQLAVKAIESGGTYTEILHSYKQLKDEFAEDVKEWGKFALARQLLTRTVEQYKQKQLPIMLEKAEENLAFLTDGKYIRIIPKQEGAGFLVASNNHVIYEAKELSQGTTEQLYLSIRIALAQTFYSQYSFPFIIDDSFVNFDEKRTSKVMELLKSCKNNQLIFFTCHRHLLSLFSERSVYKLPTEEIKASS